VRIGSGTKPATPTPTPKPTNNNSTTGSAPKPSTAMPPLAPERELVPIYELIKQNQWQQARAQIQALVSRAPEVAKYKALHHYTMGREAQLDRRLDDARVELHTALELDPDLQLAKTALGELFSRRR
jgi:hypothetical protein